MRITPARRPILGRASRLLATLAVLAIPMGTAIVITAQPAAASCTGTCLNDTDPYATGCSAGNYEVTGASDPIYGGTLELWYGPSPNCGTNWTRYYSPNTIQHYIWVVQRIYLNGNTYYNSSDKFGFKYAGWTWSDQIYSPQWPADACEQEYYIQTKSWGPVVCTGQFTMPGATMI